MQSVSQQPLDILKQYFGFSEFRPLQLEIIEQVLQKEDALVLMPTGGGKSVCYQVPALLQDGLTLVISPLIALMKDQVDALLLNGIAAASLHSGMTAAEKRNVEERLIRKEIKLLYVSPERLFAESQQLMQLLKQLEISLIAIDEAHCISHWGHDFRVEYLRLGELRTHFKNAVFIALTATADARTRSDMVDKLALKHAKQFISSFNRPNIRYWVRPKKNARDQLLDFLQEQSGKSGIIYCLSRKRTESTTEWLNDHGYKAVAYHAGMDAATRNKNQEMFQRDEVDLVVATIAFGMGIDKSNVRFVVHLDLPKNIESYYQETGRAGRDGLDSEALLFFSPGDAIMLKQFIQHEDPKHQALMNQKLDQMVDYGRISSCRRSFLLQYFDEQAPETCGNCDNCLHKPLQEEAGLQARQALSAVGRTGQLFGSAYVIDVLKGSKAEKIRPNHRELAVYGLGADKSREFWQQLFRDLLTQGLLEQDVMYKSLKFTGKTREFLKSNEPFYVNLPKEIDFTDTQSTYATYEAGLFWQLKEQRSKWAAEQNVPAYLIFSDAVLIEIASWLPMNGDDLLRINGIGAHKAQLYGDVLLQLVQAYCKQHQLESRMMAMRRQRKNFQAKTKANKPAQGTSHIISFDMFKAGKTVADIAETRGFQLSTIEGHLAVFVANGDLAATELVQEARLHAIRQAIAGQEQKSLSELKNLVGDAYSYGEIRIALADWQSKS